MEQYDSFVGFIDAELSGCSSIDWGTYGLSAGQHFKDADASGDGCIVPADGFNTIDGWNGNSKVVLTGAIEDYVVSRLNDHTVLAFNKATGNSGYWLNGVEDLRIGGGDYKITDSGLDPGPFSRSIPFAPSTRSADGAFRISYPGKEDEIVVYRASDNAEEFPPSVHGGDGNDLLIHVDDRPSLIAANPAQPDRPAALLYGGAGRDMLVAMGVHQGTVIMDGGADADRLVPHSARTISWGGPGADHYDFSGATGGHTVSDWNAEDVLNLSGWYANHIAALRSLRRDGNSTVIPLPRGLPKNDYEMGSVTISGGVPAGVLGPRLITQ